MREPDLRGPQQAGADPAGSAEVTADPAPTSELQRVRNERDGYLDLTRRTRAELALSFEEAVFGVTTELRSPKTRLAEAVEAHSAERGARSRDAKSTEYANAWWERIPRDGRTRGCMPFAELENC